MNCLTEAASEICHFMAKNQWRFCIIGGLALQHWGEPRTTLDVDITLLTGWGEEVPYADALLTAFSSRIDDARNFALENRILLLKSSNGKDIDIAFGALPFEEEMVARAMRREKLRGKPYDWREVDALLSLGDNAGLPSRTTSGMIEMQRRFMNLRKKGSS